MISESEQNPALINGKVYFEETLKNKVSIKLDKDNERFAEKKSQISVILHTEKGIK